MMEKIQSITIQNALDQGYKVAQLWDLYSRPISSGEVYNAKGALLKGTAYVNWAYWENKNIVTHNFVATLSNGTELSQANFSDLKASLGIKADPVLTPSGTQFEIKMAGWENPEEGLAEVTGLVGLYLIYLDNDDWIKVFDAADGTTTSSHTFPVHKGHDFKILTQENFDYELSEFNLDGPIPTFKKHLRADFKGAELDIHMPTEVTCTVKIANRNLDKVWIKYIN